MFKEWVLGGELDLFLGVGLSLVSRPCFTTAGGHFSNLLSEILTFVTDIHVRTCMSVTKVNISDKRLEK